MSRIPYEHELSNKSVGRFRRAVAALIRVYQSEEYWLTQCVLVATGLPEKTPTELRVKKRIIARYEKERTKVCYEIQDLEDALRATDTRRFKDTAPSYAKKYVRDEFDHAVRVTNFRIGKKE